MENLIIQWLANHISHAIILAGALSIAFGKRIWGWGKTILGMQSEIHYTQQRLADGFKTERDECEAKLKRLQATLATCRRRAIEIQEDLDARDDMSAQDRAYIRALERLCRENQIDTEDLKKAIVDEYAERRTWE